MGVFAGYVIHCPQLCAWLTKHNEYFGDETDMGPLLYHLLRRHDMYPRLICDIIPFDHKGDVVFLLARVIRNDDMSPGLVRERESDREAKKELLEYGGLKEEDLEWATCSIGC
ncbi:hypothetical protein P691DRAFT_807834 [Macrolepiota fuliginosa MF-IS2]|uniref:Uncharacterized protein n=1 Tax=Macrolepiota fuliginosa MF-IS2 TaxID=1400762 RepID=A0A9P5XJE0_9AGAR|nr:hypothetical protein P691DRAFT_807834 [Macrolepiota fuliginosa MF-IS2]